VGIWPFGRKKNWGNDINEKVGEQQKSYPKRGYGNTETRKIPSGSQLSENHVKNLFSPPGNHQGKKFHDKKYIAPSCYEIYYFGVWIL